MAMEYLMESAPFRPNGGGGGGKDSDSNSSFMVDDQDGFSGRRPKKKRIKSLGGKRQPSLAERSIR